MAISPNRYSGRSTFIPKPHSITTPAPFGETRNEPSASTQPAPQTAGRLASSGLSSRRVRANAHGTANTRKAAASGAAMSTSMLRWIRAAYGTVLAGTSPYSASSRDGSRPAFRSEKTAAAASA